MDSIKDLPIARAATQVPGQGIENLVVTGFGGAFKQRDRRHDEPRCTETTLHGASLRKRALDRMEGVTLSQTLDRAQVLPIHLRGEYQARVDRGTIHQDCARPALPLPASFLDPRQPELVAQHINAPMMRMDVEFCLPTVYCETDLHSYPQEIVRAQTGLADLTTICYVRRATAWTSMRTPGGSAATPMHAREGGSDGKNSAYTWFTVETSARFRR